MAEPPVCAGCGGRHWFLDPCGTREVSDAAVRGAGRAGQAGAADGVGEREGAAEPRFPGGSLAATASADEIEKALRHYRAHKASAAARQRRKRAAATDHKG
jgi:hypothetical protein